LRLESCLEHRGIDSGAEEKLPRDVGRKEAEVWPDGGTLQIEVTSGSAANAEGDGRQDIGLGMKRFQTLCGPIGLRRQVGYCSNCHETSALPDQRLGVDEPGITPGMRRAVWRMVLEMAYEPSTLLLRDTLGFTPCSSREIERIANHSGGPDGLGVKSFMAAKSTDGLAVDGTVIPGLPGSQEHTVICHEVKLDTVFDHRDIEAPFYVAAPEDSEPLGKRLWKEFEYRELNGNCLFRCWVMARNGSGILLTYISREFLNCWICITQPGSCTKQPPPSGQRGLPTRGGIGLWISSKAEI
jgi:hypothetical protein